jgi:hypothetical protein
MSYDIFYRKQFIKVSETEVIPFFEGGSSNLYDVSYKGKERRSRSWENQRINGKTIVQHYELAEYIRVYQNTLIERGINNRDEYKDDSWLYNPKRFGYHASLSINGKSTRNTSFNDFKNYYINGIKKAKTIEELVENHIEITIYVSPYSKDDIVKNGLEMKPNVRLVTTQQLIDTINEFTEYYKNVPNCFYLTTYNGYAIERYLKNNSIERVRKEKQLVTLKEYYVIQCPNGYTLSRLIPSGYKYSYYVSNRCKIFTSLKQAESYLKRMNRPGFSVLKSTNEINVYL